MLGGKGEVDLCENIGGRQRVFNIYLPKHIGEGGALLSPPVPTYMDSNAQIARVLLFTFLLFASNSNHIYK